MGEQKLTEGRIVNYVMDKGPHKGEVRPAIVVKVWNNTCANLQVFTDGSNDGLAPDEGTYWVSSSLYSEEPKERHWHWPVKNEKTALQADKHGRLPKGGTVKVKGFNS